MVIIKSYARSYSGTMIDSRHQWVNDKAICCLLVTAKADYDRHNLELSDSGKKPLPHNLCVVTLGEAAVWFKTVKKTDKKGNQNFADTMMFSSRQLTRADCK